MNKLNLLFGRKPLDFIPRFGKSFSVVRSMVLGLTRASPRLPILLQINATSKCNFNCPMCLRQQLRGPAIKSATEMSFKFFKNLVDEIKPLHVALDGLGEPLMFNELPKFIELCRDRGIITSLHSNMLLMSGDKLKSFLKCVPNILTFSFHGATPESFWSVTQTDSFNVCVENFENLLYNIDRRKTQLRIKCALQTKNLQDYGKMFECVKKWGLLGNCFITPVYDYGSKNGVLPTPLDKKRVLGSLEEEIANCDEANKKEFLVKWRNALLNLKSVKEIQETGPCFLPWVSTSVSFQGDVFPCCHLLERGKEYVMGNINNSKFSDIWNGPKYSEFRERLTDNRNGLEACKACTTVDWAMLKNYGFLAFGQSRWKQQK